MDEIRTFGEEERRESADGSLEAIRECMSKVSAGDACGVVIVALDEYGVRQFWRVVPQTRECLSECAAVLAHTADRMQRQWMATALRLGEMGPALTEVRQQDDDDGE